MLKKTTFWTVLFWTTGVLAQDSLSSQAPLAFNDEVELIDGSIYRGTIAESKPEEYIIFITITGKTLRLSPKQVVYAGPLRKKESETPVEAFSGNDLEVIGRKVPLLFESPQKGLSLFVHRGSASLQSFSGTGSLYAYGKSDQYIKICSAPCKFKIVEGNYRFGLEYKDKIVDAGTINIEEPLVLTGEAIDRRKERITFYILSAASLVAGLALTPFSINPDTEEINGGALAGATNLILGSLVFLCVGASIEDRAVIRATPIKLNGS